MRPEHVAGAFAIATPRLVLREWHDADHAALYAICNDPRVMRFIGPPQTADEVQAGLARLRASQSDNGYCFWAVERREDGALIGFCGLKPGQPHTPIAERIEIGWRLAADAWGQGYAQEAAQASLSWGWANLDAPSIWAIAAAANDRSWRLMERLGMARHADLDFAFPDMPADGPLSQCITYSIGRPV